MLKYDPFFFLSPLIIAYARLRMDMCWQGIIAVGLPNLLQIEGQLELVMFFLAFVTNSSMFYYYAFEY